MNTYVYSDNPARRRAALRAALIVASYYRDDVLANYALRQLGGLAGAW